MKTCSGKGGPRRAYKYVVFIANFNIPSLAAGSFIDLKKFIFYWFPILICCVLIYIQSAYPAPENIPHLPVFDKAVHFAVYALLSILFFRAYRTTRIKANLKTVMILSILSSVVYGVSDEIHQHFVPFRHADFLDVLADILGSISGVYFYQFILPKLRVSNSDRTLKR